MSTALRFSLLDAQATEEAIQENGGGGGGGGYIRPTMIAPAVERAPLPPPPPRQPDAIPIDATITTYTPVAQPAPLAQSDRVGTSAMIGPQPTGAAAIPEVKVTEGQRNYLTVVGIALAVVGIAVAIWAATKGR